MDVFVSVGSDLSPQQEALVDSLEDYLRRIGLIPHTIGRNKFSSKAPLDAVMELMDTCSGVVVFALERFYFERGEERRGSAKQRPLTQITMATAWNQIEAAIGYSRGLPVLVVIDGKLRRDGMLESSNGWWVHEIDVDNESLNMPQLAAILDDFRTRLTEVRQAPEAKRHAVPDVARLTIGGLWTALGPAQGWSVLVALAAALSAAFGLGIRFG